MRSHMDTVLQETIDYVAVTRLQRAYADAVTRAAWSEFTEFFVPDARVVIDKRDGESFELTGPEAIGTFISESISVFEFFEFVILNTRLMLNPAVDGDSANGRLYFAELRQDRATGRWSTAYGVYHDRYTKIDGQWWFAGRRHHSLARTSRDYDTFPFPSGELF
jgi:hypothetical protein